jgi:transcriptional regulator with PAS, ATPase and Fis domain
VETINANGLTLDTLISGLHEGVFMMDRDRRVVMFNPACEQLTGLAAQEVLGTACACDKPGECQSGPPANAASALCPGYPAFCGSCTFHRKRLQADNGRWIEATYSTMTDTEGQPECVVGLVRDVSDVVAREQESEQLRREVERLRGRSPADHSDGNGHSNGKEPAAVTAALDDRLADVERQAILEALRHAGGQRSRAARLMGISRSRLYRRMGALGIIPSQIE